MNDGYLCDNCGLLGDFREQMENHVRLYHRIGRLIGVRYEKTGLELKVVSYGQ